MFLDSKKLAFSQLNSNLWRILFRLSIVSTKLGIELGMPNMKEHVHNKKEWCEWGKGLGFMEFTNKGFFGRCKQGVKRP